MRLFLSVISLAAASFCCQDGKSATVPAPVPAVEEPICHVPIKVRKEATRIVFIDCDGGETEMRFSEVTGPEGKPGATGDRGPSGASGRDGKPAPEEKAIDYCRHDPVTHINHTIQLKPSEIVSRFSGYYGQADYPGNCGTTEGVCACDAPICHNARPQMRHYFGENLGKDWTGFENITEEN